MQHKNRIALITCLCLFSPLDAYSFGKSNHEKITLAAVKNGFPLPSMEVECPDYFPEDFFYYLYEYIGHAKDIEFLSEFYKRWPKPASFDVFEIKGFFDLTRNPNFDINGFDVLDCSALTSFQAFLVNESVRPDVDGRNQERLLFDKMTGQVRGSDGAFPEDPIILDLGGISGLPSQAHAHYAIVHQTDSSLLTLLFQPERFAVAEGGRLVTLGPDMMRTHFLLSLIAGTWDGEGAEALATSYLGSALHYLQDASDPLHTTQVGNVVVVFDSLIGHLINIVKCFGGYLCKMSPIMESASTVISNYHLFTEALWDEEDDEYIPMKVSWDAMDYEELLDYALKLPEEVSSRVSTMASSLFEKVSDTVKLDVKFGLQKLSDGEFNPHDYIAKEIYINDIQKIGRDSRKMAFQASYELILAFVELLQWSATEEGKRIIATRLLHDRMSAIKAREARLKQWMERHPGGIAPKEDVKYWWVWLIVGFIVVIPILILVFAIVVIVALVRYDTRRTKAVGNTLPHSDQMVN